MTPVSHLRVQWLIRAPTPGLYVTKLYMQNMNNLQKIEYTPIESVSSNPSSSVQKYFIYV